MRLTSIILPCVPTSTIKFAAYQYKDQIDQFVDACTDELIERINYVSGKIIRLEDPRLESTINTLTINATIDTQSLPALNDMAEIYDDFGFKDNLVAMIKERSKAKNESFKGDELDMPFHHWHSLWITCYLAELSAAANSRIADSDEKLLEVLALAGKKILNQMQAEVNH